MTNVNELFATANEEAATGAHSLSGTAELNAVSAQVAGEIIATVNEDVNQYREKLTASKADHNAMDAFINEMYALEQVNVDFLRNLPAETLESMLKSQQSKRSRTKSKAMTLDNYRSMMTGAVAENLLRMVLGKEKSATGSRRTSGQVYFTDEELAELTENQEQLRKELRNVQSKKSIYKAKGEPAEDDVHWQDLLKAEAQLKSIRISNTGAKTVEVDTTKTALADMLGDIDPTTLKAGDSKELLAKIKEMIG